MSARVTLPGTALRTRGGRVSLRVERRPVLAGVALVAAMLALLVVAVATGEYPLSLSEVAVTLLGGGDQATSFIVETLRLPRALCAIAVGAALGVAGAIFQSLTRNPLGSPDIVGFSQGAAVGAVIVVLTLGGSTLEASAGALTGGSLAALAVYLLAYRDGVQGYRLVLIGIGMTFLLLAVVDFLVTRARVEDAHEAAGWLVGSLNARGWDHVVPVAVALALLLPVAAAGAPRLRLLELGDDAAQALGVRAERTRALMIAVAVGLSAAAVAGAGPVLFVALAAPQIARRLTRATGPGVLAAALTGAVLLQASDIVAQRLLAPTTLPVGVVTGALGGAYLAWLLAHEWRTGRA